jgi:hypothetical protein
MSRRSRTSVAYLCLVVVALAIPARRGGVRLCRASAAVGPAAGSRSRSSSGTTRTRPCESACWKLPAAMRARRGLPRRLPDLTARLASPVGRLRRRVAGRGDARRVTERTLRNSGWSGPSGVRSGRSIPFTKAHGNLQGLDEGCPGQHRKGRAQESVVELYGHFDSPGKQIRPNEGNSVPELANLAGHVC